MNRNDVIFSAFVDELTKQAEVPEFLRNMAMGAALSLPLGAQTSKPATPQPAPPPLKPIPSLDVQNRIPSWTEMMAAKTPPNLPENWHRIKSKITNYCTCPTCCGKFSEGGEDRPTAYGGRALQLGAAVDPDMIPKNSWLYIPGQGWVMADDTGGAMRQSGKKGQFHIDVRQPIGTMTEEERHQAALNKGRLDNYPVIVAPPPDRDQLKSRKFKPPELPFEAPPDNKHLLDILRKYNETTGPIKFQPPKKKMPESAPAPAPTKNTPGSVKAAPVKPVPKKKTEPPLPFLPDPPRRPR